MAALVFCFSVGLIAAGISARHNGPVDVGFLPPAPPIWPLDPVPGASAPGTEHKIFPYSVIAGGVNSPQELREAVLRDPVVAQHYAGFDLRNARRITLDAPQVAYVSYRVGNNVFWTKKKLTLAKGEAVITDGRTIARARCGNRVSVSPVRPNLPGEPSAEDFEAPAAAPRASTPYLAAYSPAPAAPPTGFTPSTSGLPPSTFYPIPFFPFPGGGGPTPHSGTNPPGGGADSSRRRKWHTSRGWRWYASKRRRRNPAGRWWWCTPPSGGGGTPPGCGTGGSGGSGGTGGSGGSGSGGCGGGGGTPPGGGGNSPRRWRWNSSHWCPRACDWHFAARGPRVWLCPAPQAQGVII